MATVTISNRDGKLPAGVESEARKIAGKILRCELRGKRDEVGITFVDDKEIRKLNREYRKLDKATDVLSFEMGEEGMLGDIVISVETAGRNSKRFGVSLGDEIRRLVVHGILHLLGYDHMKKSDRKAMMKKEEGYLK